METKAVVFIANDNDEYLIKKTGFKYETFSYDKDLSRTMIINNLKEELNINIPPKALRWVADFTIHNLSITLYKLRLEASDYDELIISKNLYFLSKLDVIDIISNGYFRKVDAYAFNKYIKQPHRSYE